MNRPSFGTLLGRGLLKRCPLCGHKKVFRSWSQMVDNCPSCGFRFNREPGYWVGAIIVNTAVVEAIFGIWFVAALISMWPDIDWRWPALAGVVTNGILPWLFYPRSKTLWLGFDLYFNPRRADEGRTA